MSGGLVGSVVVCFVGGFEIESGHVRYLPRPLICQGPRQVAGRLRLVSQHTNRLHHHHVVWGFKTYM